MDEESIPEEEHTPGEWEIHTEASCADAGLKIQKCSVCKAELASDIIEATGEHVASDWIIERVENIDYL